MISIRCASLGNTSRIFLTDRAERAKSGVGSWQRFLCVSSQCSSRIYHLCPSVIHTAHTPLLRRPDPPVCSCCPLLNMHPSHFSTVACDPVLTPKNTRGSSEALTGSLNRYAARQATPAQEDERRAARAGMAGHATFHVSQSSHATAQA